MKTSCGKFLNLAHYFPHDVKLRLLAHSWSFLANQKARNAIVGAENLLKRDIGNFTITAEIHARSLANWKTLRLVPQNASCELFVGQVSATSPFV